MSTEPAILARNRPFGDRTMAERRNLVIASAAGLALNAGSVAELLGFTFGATIDPHLARGAFCLSIIYLEVMFVVFIFGDVSMWVGATTLKDFWLYQEKYEAALEALRQTRPPNTTTPWPTGVDETISNLATCLRAVGELFRHVEEAGAWANRIRWLQIVVIETGFPLLLGAVAIWKLWPDALPFLSKVFA